MVMCDHFATNSPTIINHGHATPLLSVKNRFDRIHINYFQENPPYSKGAFRIEINFPAEYPFKPPKICFKTKIYHPNIDETGQVCLPIISTENWKPATKTDQGNFK